MGIVFTLLLKFYYMWENRRRDNNKEGLQHQENSEFLDLTDLQNREFRVSRFDMLMQWTISDISLVQTLGSLEQVPTNILPRVYNDLHIETCLQMTSCVFDGRHTYLALLLFPTCLRQRNF